MLPRDSIAFLKTQSLPLEKECRYVVQLAPAPFLRLLAVEQEKQDHSLAADSRRNSPAVIVPILHYRYFEVGGGK